jgi:hypothetical protein
MRSKLEVDCSDLSEGVKKAYVFGCLGGHAAIAMRWHLETVMSSEELMTKLEEVYASSAYTTEAGHRLRALRQGNGDYTSFEEEFRRLLLEAGAIQWEQSTQVDLFKRALRGNLRSALEGPMAIQSDPSLAQWMNAARRLSASTAGWKGFRANQGSSYAPANKAPSGAHFETTTGQYPVVIEVDRARAAQTTGVAQRSTQSQTHQRAAWVSKEEGERRMKASYCLRCGASNHFIAKCPYGAPRRPREERVRAVATPLLEADKPAAATDTAANQRAAKE